MAPFAMLRAQRRIRHAMHARASALDLSQLGLRALPAELGQLTNLQILVLTRNRLRVLPAEVCQLTNLQTLVLTGNRLRVLPAEVCQLTNLQTLVLSFNQLTVLPAELGQLTNLKELFLSNNRLTALPSELGQLTNLQTLEFENNPLVAPLPELAKQGVRAVLAYLRSLDDAEAQYEAKLLLVGDPEAGKSSLIARLRGEGFLPGRSSTHGIERNQLQVQHPAEPTTITLHTWDFGGQPLYQATHQLFMTPNALYLLVWDARRGDAERIDGWLRRIRLLVGDQARVLVAATHADEHRADAELDYPTLAERYGTILGGLYEVDNRSGAGLTELRTALAQQAALLPQMGEQISRRWTASRDRLLTHRAPQLPYQACIALCAEHGLDQAQADALLGLLHVRGQLLHYATDPGLAGVVVLQPEWLTKAISYVLEDRPTAAAGGVLDHTRLPAIWQHRPDGPAYPQDLHPFLLRLMERFDVSWRLGPPDADATASLVGQLVPHPRPPLPWNLDDPPLPGARTLSVRCHLDDPAPGLVAWLTVRNHRFSTGRHWRRGVFVALPDEFASQGLLELVDEHQLALTVHAPAPEHFFHVLLDSVRELIRHRWPGMRYQLLVPCPHRPWGQAPCAGRFPLAALQQLRADGEPTVTCPFCGTAQDVTRLLTGYTSITGPTPASVSELLARLDDFETIRNQLARIEQTGHDTHAAVAVAAGQTRTLLKLWTSEYEATSGCPRLFTLTPTGKHGLAKMAVGSDRYQLTLWCEHHDQPHPWGPATYPLTRPREWLVTIAPHALRVLGILRHVLQLAGPALTLTGLPGVDVKQVKDDLEAMAKLLDQLPTHPPHQPTDQPAALDAAAQAEVATAEGPALRALRAVLAEVDAARTFGSLRVVTTASQDVLWVCPTHYPIYNPDLPVMATAAGAAPAANEPTTR